LARCGRAVLDGALPEDAEETARYALTGFGRDEWFVDDEGVYRPKVVSPCEVRAKVLKHKPPRGPALAGCPRRRERERRSE
jgi:hypothetical protein